MGSILEITFSVFMFFSTLYLITASDNMNDDSLDRGAHSDRGGLWFGPRLGKRSLQLIDEDKSQTFLRLLEAAEALKYYYDQMPYQMQADAPQKVAKKVIFTPKLGRAADPDVEKKYDNLDFTPRLGRKLPERVPAPPEEEDSVPDPVMSNPRANYFSPRLGRNYNFSPRLGRELYDIYPRTQIRVARSINKTKTN